MVVSDTEEKKVEKETAEWSAVGQPGKTSLKRQSCKPCQYWGERVFLAAGTPSAKALGQEHA